MNEELPSTAILMTNPSTANIYTVDFTTMYCVNNLAALGYGSVSIVNLFSRMTTKLDLRGELDELAISENPEQIIKSASETDIFIVATGRIAVTHKKVAVYQHNLFEKLRQFQGKIHTIAASDGTENLHPLCLQEILVRLHTKRAMFNRYPNISTHYLTITPAKPDWTKPSAWMWKVRLKKIWRGTHHCSA